MTTRLGCLLLLAALAAAGCKGKTPPAPRLRIVAIEVQDRTAAPERLPGLDDEVMRGWIDERLRKAPEVQLDLGGAEAGGYRLSLEIGVGQRGAAEDGPAGRVVVASARASVPGASEGVDLQASALKALPPGVGVEAVRKIVDGLMDDLVYQARLAVGPPQAVVQALGDRKDPARLAAAEEIAGVRKLREAVPALIQLLQHKDEQVSDRAIGALVAIGDRAAVKPLTRMASFQDTARMAKVLDAIGALGGQEAKDYLEFVSTGHEDTDIRNLASEALERMNRAAKPKP